MLILFLHKKSLPPCSFLTLSITSFLFGIIYPHTLHLQYKGTLTSVSRHWKWKSFLILSYCRISSSSSFKCIFTKLVTLILISVFKRAKTLFLDLLCFFSPVFLSSLCSYVLLILLSCLKVVGVSMSTILWRLFVTCFTAMLIGLTCIILIIYSASFIFSCISTICRVQVTTLLVRSPIVQYFFWIIKFGFWWAQLDGFGNLWPVLCIYSDKLTFLVFYN